MIETMLPRPLLALLHICDSLFPIGGFGYSDGLEAATATGLVKTPADLQAWLDVCLDEVVGRMDGPAALRAWSAFDRRDWWALCQLDGEITAMRPSSAIRRSSRAMKVRLVTTWNALYPDRRLAQAWKGWSRGFGGNAVRASGPRVKAEWTPLWVPAQVRDARSPSVVGRHARLDLTFLYRDGRTVLARAYAEPPFRVGQWFAEGDGVHMILTSSAPGAFGHDHLKQIVRNVPEAELSENDRLRRASPRHTVSMQS